MSLIVGIDLGTTNSLIGAMDAGFPILIAGSDGERLTPSIVHIPTSGEPMVGRPAARIRAQSPERTIYSIKRFIGRREGDVPAAVDYTISGSPLQVHANGRKFTPEEISSFVLRKLRADAEAALGQEVTRAVITVPAYFNDAQRSATKRAGELAGLIVERIINEPTAAALAYGLDRLKERAKIAVFDFGGGTFDISILELNAGIFHVLSTNGNTSLGGDDIDAALMAKCALPISDWEKRDVLIEAKHRLSTETAVEIPLPFAADGKSVLFRMTRAELEQVAEPIVNRTRAHCLRALADARVKPEELSEVILVGGMTRMPLVRRFVGSIFGREPNASQNPDEAVAIGATIQAGVLGGALRDIVLLDVTPLSLGIETFGGLMNVIIPRNSTIPCKAGEMFTNAVPGQDEMLIRVLQGERELANDNWELGQFPLKFSKTAKGQARVGVQFEIDANGILHVLARDTATGLERRVEMRSAVDVADAAVEKMLDESLAHAFEDMSARQFAEAKMRADDLLAAVRSAIEKLGNDLSAESRVEVDRRVAEVERAVGIRSVPALKKANEELDHETEHLAALLIEQALRE